MSARAATAPHRRGWRTVLLAAVAAFLIFFLITCVRIARQQWRDEARRADAIVVFGAAEYVGRPSPIFRARLDHAYTLFTRGLAPYVIVTGGYGEDPHFSEGGVGRDYLIKRGVPENQVVAETYSSNTSREAERAARIMKINGMRTCVAVSDPYHMFRIKAALARNGIETYASPRPEVQPVGERVLSILREALSYTAWKAHLT